MRRHPRGRVRIGERYDVGGVVHIIGQANKWDQWSTACYQWHHTTLKGKYMTFTNKPATCLHCIAASKA